ncbi:MAG: polysaccharide biosynthesis tyrosine autokinase [Acidobacteriaceae bacterium]
MQGWTTPAQNAQPGSPSPVTNPTPQPAVVTSADISKMLFKRKWVIFAVTLLGAAIGLYHAETTVPQYEATSQIFIDLGGSGNLGLGDSTSQTLLLDMPDVMFQTQVQIMRSDTAALDAIKLLDLYHTPPYSSVFGKTPYNGQLTPEQRTALVGMFQASTRIAVVPNTALVNVSFRSPDPTLAKNAANALVEAYIERDLQARYEGSTRISKWLATQLTGLKEQAETNQKDLSNYVQKNNIVATGPQGGSLVLDSLETVNQQLAEAKADRIVKEARYKMAQTRNPELLVSVAPGTILSSLRQQQADMMVQKAQLQSKFGPDYPKVQELNKQLGTVQSDIDTEITNLTKRFAVEYHTAQQTEGLLQTRLDTLTKAAYQQNQSAAQFEILKHNAESAGELYSALELKLQEAGITSGLNSNNVDVIDPATAPAAPVVPNKQSDLLFGFLGGLLAGFVLAFVLETMDDTLRTSEEVETISHLPTLAVVPHFATKRETPVGVKPGTPQLLPDLVSYLEPQSIAAESYRTLRSSILLSAVDREPRVLLITSSLAEEGKSTTAANLAISFAQRQEKVLLVDADLRRGTTHLKFGISNAAGLSTMLVKESGVEAYQHPLPDMPWLTVLARGPMAPNPGEILASRAMEELMEHWRTEYDRIILDASPVLAVSDSLGLAPQCDNVMILVRSGVTRRKALVKTRDWLRRAGARITGTVVNDVNLKLENYYTYSRRYGYNYQSNYGAGYGVSNGEK